MLLIVTWTALKAYRLALILSALFLAQSLAQISPLAGSMSHITPQQMGSNSTPPAYERISIMNEDDIEKLYPLIASYISNPSLANSLKEISFNIREWPRAAPVCTGFSEIEVPPEPVKPVDEDAHSTLVTHIHSLSLEQEMTDQIVDSISWKKQHRLGLHPENKKELDRNNRAFAYVSVVVLLSLCKNISTLRVGHVEKKSLIEKYLLKSNYGRLSQPILQHLRTFEILAGSSDYLDTRMYDTTEFLDYIRLISRLPSIETITMEGLGAYQPNRKIMPPGISPIKNIRMSHVAISSPMLSTIIRGPKALEEFSVSMGGLWTHDGDILDLDLPTYGYERELLDKRVTPTWREKDKFLEMDEAESVLPRWVGDIPDDRTYGWTIGSFSDFEALTHLSVGVRALFGPKAGHVVKLPYDLEETPPVRLVDSLPPSLEYFCLYGYAKGENEEVDGQVAELMEKRAERFPRLKEIRGVESKVLGVGRVPSERDEKDLWRRPERDWSWVVGTL